MFGWLRRLLGRGEAVAAPDSRYVVVDVETTGLSPAAGRIVEIAVVTLNPLGRVIGEWTTRVNPEGPVGATHIHGITDEDVATAPRFAEILPTLNHLLRGGAVVGHQAPFDMAFLRAEYRRAGWQLPELPALCTLQASHYYLPSLPRRNLSSCCQATGIGHHGAHSALGDARATAALLGWFLNPSTAPAVRADDQAILRAAQHVTWPSGAQWAPIPPDNAGRRIRVSAAKPASKALVELVSRFSLLQAAEAGATQAMVTYLEKVAEVLEDGVLTDEEATELKDLAQLYGFTPEDVGAANRAFLLALAHEALQDGKVAQNERAELKHLAGVLDVDERHISGMLKRAESERTKRLGAGLAPLPPDWQHGVPLRVGDRVVFTGCDDALRDRLEQASEDRGVRVMGSVNAKTALVVTDGSFNGTKLATARDLGTRLVDPDTYQTLLTHLQPALD